MQQQRRFMSVLIRPQKCLLTLNKKHCALSLAFALFLVAVNPTLSAQTELTDGDSQVNKALIPEVAVIGTREPLEMQQQSANVFVLTNDEVNNIAPVHIQQALSRVPGVALQRGNGQESLPSIRSAVLSGAGACGNVLILEEAIAVRGAGSCNVNELFDTHFEHAQQIEVVRGAGSAFYGSNALSGSVNVVLPSNGDGFASLELGSNSYIRTKAAASYGANRFFASLSRDGGYRDDSGYDQQKLSWRHASNLGDWEIEAGATYTNLDQETAGFIVGLDSYRNRSLARQNLNPEAFRKTRSLRAWLKAATQINASTRFNSSVYLRDTDMDFRLHFLPGTPLEQNQQQGLGWQSALNVKIKDNVQWAVGFDGDFTDSELLQTQDEPTSGSAFLQATIPTGTHYDYEVQAQQIAIFSHFDWLLNDHWQLISGLRLERMDYDYDNLSLDGRTKDDGTECSFGGCRYSRPADRKDSFTNVSPKLEIRYTAKQNWRLSLAVADSFRAPQTTELYRLQREQLSADLDSVDALSVELALRYNNNDVNFNVSAYRLDTDNVIIRDANFFNIDGQSTISEGIEFSVGKQLNDHWSVKTIGSYANHQYSSDLILDGTNINGNQVDTAPKFVGSVFLNWSPSSNLDFELELQKVSSYYLEPVNLYEYQGHTLINARSNYKVNERLVLTARLLNVENQAYAERADFTVFTNERYFPGEPRSLFMQAKLSF